MKSKQIVRISAKRHKKAITSLSSEGKYLISCSTEDDLISVFDYQQQDEVGQISLQLPDELPTYVISFNHNCLLIGTSRGQIHVYDITAKRLLLDIKTKLKVKMKSELPIIQIKKLPAADKKSSQNVFAAVSASGQIKLFTIVRTETQIEFQDIKDIQKDTTLSQPQNQNMNTQLQQCPLITLPNGAIVCTKKKSGGSTVIGLWNVNQNQIDKNAGCVAGCAPGCNIFWSRAEAIVIIWTFYHENLFKIWISANCLIKWHKW